MILPFDEANRDAMIDLVEKFQQEAFYYSTEPFDRTIVSNYYSFCMYHEDGFGRLAFSGDGELVGFIAGALVPSLFNNSKSAEDLSIYVVPEYRKRGTISVRLINAYIEWARSKGVADKFIRVSVSAGIDNEAAEKFLTRLGFSRVSSSFALGG